MKSKVAAILIALTLVWLGQSQPALASTSPEWPGRPLTAQENADLSLKQQRFHSWQKKHPTQAFTPAACPTFVFENDMSGNVVPAACPGVSLGGQFIGEPSNVQYPSGYVGNWCGPAAGTNVMLHWSASQVNNHAPVTVPADTHANTTYYNGQAWMAWFAHQIWLPAYGQSGVSTYDANYSGSPYHKGADPNVVAYGLNQVVAPIYGRNYYFSTNEANESAMYSDVAFDIENDTFPVIFDTNTNYLTGWNPGLNIGHFVEGYGVNDYTGNVSYADSMWSSAQGSPQGDHTISSHQMWQGESLEYGILIH